MSFSFLLPKPRGFTQPLTYKILIRITLQLSRWRLYHVNKGFPAFVIPDKCNQVIRL